MRTLFVSTSISSLASRDANAIEPRREFPANARLQSITTDFVENGRVPGGAVAIYANERIHLKSFGQRGLHDSRPVDAQTVFRVASLSKTFASGLAAQLVRSGSLQWTSPINSLLPELKFAKRSTTHALQLRHLLSNSSGVLPYAFDQQLESRASLNGILSQMANAPIVCKPGSCYGYQNSLFSAAALAMQTRTGAPYADLLRYRIFAPLGMAESSVGFAALQASENLALPHIQVNRRWQQVELSPSYYQAEAAAGVNSSISDMARWLAAQLGSRPDVFNEAQLQTLRQARVQANKFATSRHWKRMLRAEHYGYGWRVLQIGPASDDTLLFHAGWVKGYSAQISYSPKHRIGLVVLLNAERWLDKTAVDFWCEALQIRTGVSTCQAELPTQPR
jgi:beta-lactamase class C